jgi:hypothetical protein
VANRLLSIYLNDHLAGATAGVELARRARGSNRESADFGEPLADLCAEIEADRKTLERLMDELGVRRDPLKVKAGWLGEKLGRLKLNGQLRGYSPLSRVIEMEGLVIGICGKAELWATLRRALGSEWRGFDLAALEERARRQQERADDLQSRAVEAMLSADPMPGASAAAATGGPA